VTAFAAAVAVLHRDPHLSVPATWLAPVTEAEPVALRVVPVSGDELLRYGAVEIPGLSSGFKVLVADLPSPEVGGILTVGSVGWTVISPPLADARGLVWTLVGQRR
jgi:hypothetical protein